MNIFDIPVKETINTSLQAKSIMVVGKSKSGKSTFASQAPRPIFLMTENGGEGLVGFTPVPINSWGDFKNAVSQLCSSKAREKWDTVVIDTYTNLILLLDKFVGQKHTSNDKNFDFGTDLEFGKGSKDIRNELGLQLQRLANKGYLILNIVHAEDKVDFKTQRPYVGTSLSNSIYGVAEKFVDQIIYLKRETNKQGDIEHRIWFNEKGGFEGTGGRFSPAVDSVPCSFAEFEKVMIETIKKKADDLNAAPVNSSTPSVEFEVLEDGDLDLSKLKNEFDTLTNQMISADPENIKQIVKIIANVLGPNKKVAGLVQGQEPLLLEIINRLKEEEKE